jgi:hypothetical protein
MRDLLPEFLKAMSPLIKFLESKVGRITIIAGIMSIVAESILDSLNITTGPRAISVFGCSGTLLVAGVGLICTLRHDHDIPPQLRLRWYIIAMVLTAWSVLSLLLLLYSLIRIIVASVL